MFATCAQTLVPGLHLSVVAYAAVGMGALFVAVVGAPVASHAQGTRHQAAPRLSGKVDSLSAAACCVRFRTEGRAAPA